jgi:hypothetical protein
MKSKLTLSFVLAFVISIAYSQSLYHIQYNFHRPDDSITYHAFFVRYDDGSGLLRVRYLMPGTNEDVVIEMDVEEQLVPDKSGLPDTNTLVLKATSPRVVVGNDKIKLNAPVFLFKNNPLTGYFDPAGVTATEQNSSISPDTFFEAELIEGAALNRDFVLQFFSEDEDFYVNLFNNKTRGLTPVEKNTKLYLLVVADTLYK